MKESKLSLIAEEDFVDIINSLKPVVRGKELNVFPHCEVEPCKNLRGEVVDSSIESLNYVVLTNYSNPLKGDEFRYHVSSDGFEYVMSEGKVLAHNTNGHIEGRIFENPLKAIVGYINPKSKLLR